MNVEEKIEKKEKRSKRIKKIWLPIFVILIILACIALGYYYFNMQGKFQKKDGQLQENNKIENTTENQQETKQAKQEEQIEGINNGTSEVIYKDYTYNHAMGETGGVISRKKTGSDEEEEVVSYVSEQGFYYDELWIYKDKIYANIDGDLKTFNLDGSEETVVMKLGTRPSLKINFEEGQIYFTQEYTVNIAQLDGTILKQINIENTQSGEPQIIKYDKQNIYYSILTYGEDESVKGDLYAISKDNYSNKKIVTEDILENAMYASSYDFYQIEIVGDYLYYIVGSQQGSGNYFYGKLCKVKKDGTDHEIITETFGSGMEGVGDNTIPTILINNNYIYYDGNRINLENNQITPDKFTEGDKIDDEGFVYTTSLSDERTVILTKYKAGTEYEEMQTIFSKEIPDGATVMTHQTFINIRGDYIYLNIPYRDMDSGNWRGVVAYGEAYRMKKDGSDLKEL